MNSGANWKREDTENGFAWRYSKPKSIVFYVPKSLENQIKADALRDLLKRCGRDCRQYDCPFLSHDGCAIYKLAGGETE